MSHSIARPTSITPPLPLPLLLLLLLLLLSIGTGQAVADQPTMRLRLKDGSFSTGTLVGTPHDDHLGWHNQLFQQPFAFDVRNVRSLARDVDSTTQPDSAIAEETLAAGDASRLKPTRQVIEMLGGSAVVGALVGMDDAWLTVDSSTLGQVQISRTQAVAVSDAEYAGQMIYAGPLDETHWQRLGDVSDWDFEAGVLVARRPGAAIVGDVQLPAQSQINLALSWSGTPDFVLSLGTLASNRVSRVEEVPSAARLEVWANQLALVREVDGGADIAMLAELNAVNPRIELILYLDQQAGSVVACDAHGRPMETLRVAGNEPKVRTAVHLSNSGPSLTVERFEVRQWDGVIATVAEAGEQLVLAGSGQRTAGGIAGFDSQSDELRIALAGGGEQRLPLGELRRGSIASAATSAAELSSGDKPAANTSENSPENASENSPENASENAEVAQTVELVLMDRTRLKGRMLAATDSGDLRFEAHGVNGYLTIPLTAVRGVIGNSERYTDQAVELPLGTLKSDQQQLRGHLVPTDPSHAMAAGNLALVWQPTGSAISSPLSASASGSIAYRVPLPKPVVEASEQKSQPVQLIAPAIEMFLGRRGAQANADQDRAADDTGDSEGGANTKAKVAEAREILFRTGDAVDGVVEQIDESGMRFHSQQTDTQFVPHNLIQHVWLNKLSGQTSTSPEKLKRLLTVPRSLKQDPPTHLIIAVNGDYLRGRLVSLQDDKLIVEVRLETVELQTSRIAQIVWLHDRDWQAKGNADKAENPPDELVAATRGPEDPPEDTSDDTVDAQALPEVGPFLVHAIGRTERGLTFHPQSLTAGKLSGVSDLLGKCSIAVDDINQLLFGPDVPELVRQYRADPWTLSLAQLPRVYTDEGGDASANNLGDASPMVGQAATDFTLQSLAGEKFNLNSNRDRVVVLDFWASWCGPCVQTMPLVEEAVGDLGADKIQLVAVNIQEPASRVQAAVDRLQMSSTVLLDVDGQVAAAYQATAIPQTVIIDRGGNVTHVFVGGGARFVAQFKQALETVVNMPHAGPAGNPAN